MVPLPDGTFGFLVAHFQMLSWTRIAESVAAALLWFANGRVRCALAQLLWLRRLRVCCPRGVATLVGQDSEGGDGGGNQESGGRDGGGGYQEGGESKVAFQPLMVNESGDGRAEAFEVDRGVSFEN